MFHLVPGGIRHREDFGSRRFFVPVQTFEAGLARFAGEHEIQYIHLDMDVPFVPITPSERSIKEYAGNSAATCGCAA